MHFCGPEHEARRERERKEAEALRAKGIEPPTREQVDAFLADLPVPVNVLPAAVQLDVALFRGQGVAGVLALAERVCWER